MAGGARVAGDQLLLPRPPLFGMLSVLTPEHEQGATLGVAQSASSLARIFGPMFAAGLFRFHPTWPYVACAEIAIVTGLVAAALLIKSAPAWQAAKARHAAG